jgi:transporter family-2 protein
LLILWFAFYCGVDCINLFLKKKFCTDRLLLRRPIFIFLDVIFCYRGKYFSSGPQVTKKASAERGIVMNSTLLAIVVTILGGIGIAIQSTLNNILTKGVGMWTANAIVHGSGFILATSIAFWLNTVHFSGALGAPWYSLLGGMLGVGVVSAVVYAIPQLGIGFTVTTLVIAQVITAALIDHFGLLGSPVVILDWRRGLAIAFLILGAILMRK